MISRLVFFIFLSLLTLSITSGNAIKKSGLDGPLTVADFIIVPYSCTQLGSITLRGTPQPEFTFSWRNSNGDQISSTSSIVFGMATPKILYPLSVINTLSSILTPPKSRYSPSFE